MIQDIGRHSRPLCKECSLASSRRPGTSDTVTPFEGFHQTAADSCKRVLLRELVDKKMFIL